MRSSFFVFSFFMLILLSSFSNPEPSLSSEQVEYTLGEKIRLDVGPIGEYSLIIETPSGKYLQKSDTEQFIFKPEEIGEYSLTIESSEETYELYFSVIANMEIISDSLEENISLVLEETEEEILENKTFNELEVIGGVVAGEPVVFGITLGGDGQEIEIKVPKEARDISVLGDKNPINFEVQESLLKKVTNLFSEVPEKSLVIEPTKEVVEIEYTLPGPEVIEEELTLNKKQVVVSSEIHYENILASTILPKETNKLNSIKVYWKENDTYLDFEAIDSDGNLLYDSIEWVIPHLSEQTFEIIIEIIDAIHFDSNGEEIANIYDLMREIDGNGTTINAGEFIRVTFEVPLASWNDITIYAYGDENAIVEVYEANGTEKITEFRDLTEEGLYKKILLGYSGSSNSFDLRVVGGNVWFDYIVDPASSYQISTDAETTATGTNAGLPTAGKNIVRLNNGDLLSFWEDAGNDPRCALSSDDGITWPTTRAENGDYADVAVATNGTAFVYVAFETADNDVMYILRNSNTCDISSGAFADVGANTNDHFLPDVTFDENHNRFVLCTFDNDDADMEVAYTSLGATLSWTINTAVGGARTFQGCSIDTNTAGNVFIAVDDSGNTDIRVLNSSAGTFASNTEVTAFSSAVSNVHLSIRDYEILITGIDGNSDLVVLNSSNNGTTYTESVYAGTFLEAEGCIDPFGRYHFAVVENTASDAIMYIQMYNRTFSDIFTFVDNANDLRYPSVRCTNFPSGNRMDADRLEIVYTDTSNSDVYFANFSGWVNNSINGTPQIFIGSPVNTTYVVSSIPFNLTSNEYVTCNYSITSGSTNFTMTANATNTFLNATNSSVPDGTHTARYYCVDHAGNLNNSQSVTFSIQTVTPNITVISPVSGSIVADVTPLVNITLAASATSLRYNIDGGTNQTICSSSCAAGTYSFFVHVNESNHTIRFYSNDTLGVIRYNETSFEVNMNYNYFDTFTDNSSLQTILGNGVSWRSGNVTFITPRSNFSDGFESGTANWQALGGWDVVSTRFNSGASAIRANDGNEGDLTSDDIDMRNKTLINVTFWYNEDDMEDADISVYFYDGSAYDLIDSFGADQATEDLWYYKTYSTQDPQYFISNFRVRFTAAAGPGENVWIDDMDIISNSIANYSVYSVNVSQPIVEVTNVSWSSSGTDSNNYFVIQISPDGGGNWYNATNNQGLTGTATGSQLIYRTLFASNSSSESDPSLLDINISWSSSSSPAPNIFINFPFTSSITDVSPTLNVTIDGSATSLWYNVNNGANITLCTDCIAGTYTAYLYLYEQNYTVRVYSSNVVNDQKTNSTTFQIETNYNHYESYLDNSSLLGGTTNNVSWTSGNVSFSAFVFEDDFEDNSYIDNSPINWTQVSNSGACAWTIVTGIMTESSNCADASRDGTAFGGYIYPNNKTWTDFNFTTLIRSTDNDGTGVMFRFVNNSNYYRVRFEGTSDYRRLERVQAGAVTVLDSDSLVDGGLTEDQWFTLSVVVVGNSITVYLNGTNILSSSDSTFSEGNIALYSWGQDSGSFGADFESVRVTDLRSNGNFTAYKVNVSESIYSIENVTWNSYGTDSVSNNITVQVSANGGSSWVNATNGQGISTFTPGSSLFYRVLFYSNKTSNISFSNLNITWSDVSPPAINISINSPTNGSTVADVTPTLNITISGDANTVWYNVNDGTNYTICTSCNDTRTYYMLLREGNFNLSVFANNSVGTLRKNSSNFSVALNNNYYDNFDDNSSLLSNQMNRVTWGVGNVSFFSYVSNAFTDGFESGTSKWQNTGGWDIVSSPTPLVGSGAFRTNNGNEGDLITNDINTTNWTMINVTFWYLEDELEDADLAVYFYDGAGYDLIDNIGADNTPDNGWYYKTYTTQDSQYFISNFRVRFFSSPDDATEISLIDEFNITDEARANFTAYTINVTNAITLINNISWGSSGTSTTEELELEVSLNGGSTWLNTTNGQGLSGFTPNTQLLYRALYYSKNYSDMSLLDVNISWSAAPSVNIIYPVAAIYPTFVTQLNYSATAGGGSPTACWWTNNSGFTNYTVTCGQNITTTSIEGVNNWTVYANDSTGAIGYDSVSFSVDASAPQIIFLNQTNEDGENVTSSNPLEQGSVLNLLIDVIDSAVDTVWVTFWEGISGGVEKAKVFFTYVAASGWWVANVTTGFDWNNTSYNYTIYANDTGNLTSTYEGNFSLLKLNSTINVAPNPSPGSGNTNIYGYLQFSNGTYAPNRSINLWFDGNLLWFENLTAIGSYNSNQSIIDTSSSDFGDGTFYKTTESNGNVTLSSGNYSGNYTKIMDAGALVDWNSLSWNSYGQSCNATVLWQEGVDGFSGTYDSYVDGGSPNTNFGTSDTLYVDTSPTERAVLMFDVFGSGGKRIPYNSTITNANITVNVIDAGDTVTVYQILENWTEDQVTYNNRLTGTAWSSTGIANTPSRSATTESSFTPSSIGVYTFSVLSAVRSWTNQSSSNLGVVLSPGGSNTVGISSKEAIDEADRPILAVTFNSTDCTNLLMYVRLSNDQNTWTSWQQVTNGSLISDSGNKYRYLQYRAELGAVNTSLSPVLEMVSANYTAIVTNASGFYSYNMTSPTSFGTYTFLINSSIRTMFTNASTTLSVQSGVAPNVTLISPPNVSWVNSSNFNMTYNVSDLNGDVINATLYLNGVPNVSNSSAIVNNGYNNFSVSLPSGTYNWTVNATDASGLSSMPTNWTVYVDLANPIVSLIFPPNATSFSASSTNLSFNVTDNMDSNLTCSVTLDSNVIHSGIFVNNATNVNYSSGALTTGTHFWNVTCIDESYRSHTSSTYQFTITDTPPAVYLFQPENNYLNSDGDITFYFNVSDDLGITNCSLVLNQTTFIGNQSAVSFDLTLNEITVLGLGQGNYNWTVECYDSNLNYFRNSSYRNFTVDLFAPTIDLNLPSNTSVLTQSNVNFNFTVNDSIDSGLSCNLTVNSLVVDSFTATNGTLTNRLINGLYDGLNYWNVTCIDDALNSNTSLTRVITVQEPPTVFVNTTNETYFSGGFASIDYTPIDNTNLSSCSIYLNGVLNNSNASAILNGQLNEIEIFGLQDGAYNYYINCSDYVPLRANSSIYRFYMDSLAPTVNLSSPNNEAVFATNITFNFTVIDFVDSSLTCNLTVDSTVVDSNFEATNNTLTSRPISGILDGFHTWYVNCTDGSLNVGNSQIFNFTRSTAPYVELISPNNNQWLNYSPFNLTYYLEDDEGFSISYLIINGSANRSNSTSITSGQNNIFNISDFADGFYNWTVIATDLGGLNGTNTTRNFYLDRQAPRPVLYHPAHLQVMTTNNITMNYSVTDNLDSSIQCQLYLDESPETITNITNGTVRTEFQLIPDGNHTWYLSCIDEAGNSNVSETRNFTVIAPPNVTLVSPANNLRTTQQTLNFTYLPQDAIGINECSIYLDGILNQTSSSISANQNNNFTVIGILEGLHNWTVNCTDPDGNTDQPSVRNFYVDLTPPSIVLNAPEQGAILDINSNIRFNWTATDALDALLQCDLVVNGTVEENNVFVTSGVAYSTPISGINQGNNSWNVTCWDQVSNTNVSETRWFNYTYPDFSINSSGITFSDLTPKENDTITINATIFNLGYVNSTNIVVRFYRGDPDASGVQIGQNKTINITARSFNVTSIEWNATIGTSSIYVVVDPPTATNGSYVELNESNNKAFQNVSISSWHFFYGDLTQSSEFVLSDTTEERLVSWLQGNSTEANIYVTDYDSNVDWAELQALAKTNAGVNTTGDFAELDVALNMTSFVDSVNRTYFGAGTFNATDTFIVFSRTINEVPLAYSITDADFTTGILWDTNDTIGDNEYDATDREDIVFVTKVLQDTAGTYGQADYELRVPALLRNYKTTNTQTAAFYLELR